MLRTSCRWPRCHRESCWMGGILVGNPLHPDMYFNSLEQPLVILSLGMQSRTPISLITLDRPRVNAKITSSSHLVHVLSSCASSPPISVGATGRVHFCTWSTATGRLISSRNITYHMPARSDCANLRGAATLRSCPGGLDDAPRPSPCLNRRGVTGTELDLG